MNTLRIVLFSSGGEGHGRKIRKAEDLERRAQDWLAKAELAASEPALDDSWQAYVKHRDEWEALQIRMRTVVEGAAETRAAAAVEHLVRINLLCALLCVSARGSRVSSGIMHEIMHGLGGSVWECLLLCVSSLFCVLLSCTSLCVSGWDPLQVCGMCCGFSRHERAATWSERQYVCYGGRVRAAGPSSSHQ